MAKRAIDEGTLGEKEKEMRLTFEQAMEVHCAAEEIAVYCITVREA